VSEYNYFQQFVKVVLYKNFSGELRTDPRINRLEIFRRSVAVYRE